jgi:hypothetical protein
MVLFHLQTTHHAPFMGVFAYLGVAWQRRLDYTDRIVCHDGIQ